MADEGASPREQLLEACRRNNTSLLNEVLESTPKPHADLLNTAKDGVGNYCLHVAASSGAYDVLDALLDVEGLEVDPIDRLEADSPLHKAVRFVNTLRKEDWEDGGALVELLIDAGADPRLRNKAKLKAAELVDPRNTPLKDMLNKAEFAQLAGDDVIVDDDDGPGGSASDSD